MLLYISLIFLKIDHIGHGKFEGVESAACRIRCHWYRVPNANSYSITVGFFRTFHRDITPDSGRNTEVRIGTKTYKEVFLNGEFYTATDIQRRGGDVFDQCHRAYFEVFGICSQLPTCYKVVMSDFFYI